jgi:hypothetical protein
MALLVGEELAAWMIELLPFGGRSKRETDSIALANGWTCMYSWSSRALGEQNGLGTRVGAENTKYPSSHGV